MLYRLYRHHDETFQHVASVEAKNLNEAYALTNNIDSPWDENPEVTVLMPDLCQRSTSIGDLFVEVGSNIHWLVESTGFKKLN